MNWTYSVVGQHLLDARDARNMPQSYALEGKSHNQFNGKQLHTNTLPSGTAEIS